MEKPKSIFEWCQMIPKVRKELGDKDVNVEDDNVCIRIGILNNSYVYYSDDIYVKTLQSLVKDITYIPNSVISMACSYVDRPALSVMMAFITFYLFRKNGNRIYPKDISDFIGLQPEKTDLFMRIWLMQKDPKCELSNMLNDKKLIDEFIKHEFPTIIGNSDECEPMKIHIDKINHPSSYYSRFASFINNCDDTIERANNIASSSIEMEVVCDSDGTVFLVESDAVESGTIYSPYTGEKIEIRK